MKMVDRIHSEEELKSVRNQLGRVIKQRLGSKLSNRKLDEFTADFLGAKDFNTALGLAKMAESIPVGVEVYGKNVGPAHSSQSNTDANIKGWYRVLRAIVTQEYADEEDVQDMLDETVFDFVGTTKWISDNVNNQGWERQIQAIASEMALSHLRHRTSEISGVTEEDLKRCVAEAAAQVVNGTDEETPFDISFHVGY